MASDRSAIYGRCLDESHIRLGDERKIYRSLTESVACCTTSFSGAFSLDPGSGVGGPHAPSGLELECVLFHPHLSQPPPRLLSSWPDHEPRPQCPHPHRSHLSIVPGAGGAFSLLMGGISGPWTPGAGYAFCGMRSREQRRPSAHAWESWWCFHQAVVPAPRRNQRMREDARPQRWACMPRCMWCQYILGSRRKSRVASHECCSGSVWRVDRG